MVSFILDSKRHSFPSVILHVYFDYIRYTTEIILARSSARTRGKLLSKLVALGPLSIPWTKIDETSSNYLGPLCLSVTVWPPSEFKNTFFDFRCWPVRCKYSWIRKNSTPLQCGVWGYSLVESWIAFVVRWKLYIALNHREHFCFLKNARFVSRFGR